MPDYLAIDLFAGTGVLGIESISRGASRAILLEMLRPAVAGIVENLKRLRIEDKAEVHNVDTLRWMKYLETTVAAWPKAPWVVFCCPPYRMWETEVARLREGLAQMLALSPSGSFFVVEAEEPFDIAAELPEFNWDIRQYKPALVGVAEKKFSPQFSVRSDKKLKDKKFMLTPLASVADRSGRLCCTWWRSTYSTAAWA